MAIVAVAVLAGIYGSSSINVHADSTCTFSTTGTTMKLDSDCITDETIFVPDGFTLDGNGNTIIAVDPTSGNFVGGVIENAGTEAHVTKLKITTDNLSNVCEGGADRLRGIMFEGASGSITHNEVNDINKGASGCQEGNAIEIRNAPFDGTHPDTQMVLVSHNKLSDWQKTGIVANGDVGVTIQHNKVGASATQANLAPNSIQLGFGAIGIIQQNHVDGNQWFGTSNFAGTAILTFLSDVADISKNNIRGNSDVGILIFSDDGLFNNNKVFDQGKDHSNSCCDVGIWDFGNDNKVKNNKARGFDNPYQGIIGGKNKAIPGPQPNNEFF